MIALILPLLLSLASAADGPEKTWYSFVNGGSIPSTNYAYHEEWLKAFYYGFFKGRGTILNAGGPGTPIAQRGTPAALERDADGWVFTTRSTLPMPTLAATKENVRGNLRQLARDKPASATLVYDDHGSKKGTRLWLRDDLTARELAAWHSELDDKTMARSVFLHCFAGSMIADPNREIPKGIEGWDDYLKKHYRAKSCALALSAHDELGEYESWGKGWEEGYWKKLFDSIPRPSIDDWKKAIAEDDSRQILPVTTIDYLVDDFLAFFCRSLGATAAKRTTWAHSGPAAPLIDGAGGPTNEERCRELRDDKALASAIEDQKQILKTHRQAGVVYSHFTRQFLEQSDAELVRYYDHVGEEIEEVKATYLLKRDTEGSLSPADQKQYQAKLAALHTPEYESAVAKLDTFESGRKNWGELLKYFSSDQVVAELDSKAFQDKFPAFSAWRKLEENKGLDVNGLTGKSYKRMREKQLARKKLAYGQQEKKRLFVKTLLARAGFEKLNDFLLSVEKCEASPLND